MGPGGGGLEQGGFLWKSVFSWSNFDVSIFFCISINNFYNFSAYNFFRQVR